MGATNRQLARRGRLVASVLPSVLLLFLSISLCSYLRQTVLLSPCFSCPAAPLLPPYCSSSHPSPRLGASKLLKEARKRSEATIATATQPQQQLQRQAQIGWLKLARPAQVVATIGPGDGLQQETGRRDSCVRNAGRMIAVAMSSSCRGSG